MLKAIIFDIDGVLIDSHQANVDTFAQIIGKIGYSVPRDRIENALMGHTTHETFAMLLPQTTMEQRDAMVQMISDRLPQSLAEFKPTAILGCV